VKFVQFWLVFAYLVAIAMLFVPCKIQIAHLNSTTPKLYRIRRNWHNITYRKLKFVHFWPFYVNMVAMATPFAPLKFLLAYLNSPTTKTLPYTQTLSP